MTAAEKTRLLAERVMGWEVSISSLGERGAWGGWVAVDVQRSANNFHPLTNLAHAGEVLEAMRAKGWWYEVCDLSSQHIFTWRKDDRHFCATADSLQEAICHAALMTTGVKEEEL